MVTSHHGSDDAYMPRWPNGSLANQSYAYGTNEAIWAQTFRLLPLAPTSSSSPSAGGAAAIKTDDTEGTTIRLLATRHARPTRSASAASPVLCHGGFRFRFDRHRFKMISVKTDDEPTIGPPSAAVSLVHGEAVATTWPMEPLTTAYDPHGYHKGKTGFSLGNHRVEVVVSSEDADKPALVTRAEWRRRPTYARGTTSLGTPTVPGSGSSHFHHRLPRPETELAVSEIRVIGIVESSINGAAPAHTLCNLTILNETSDEALIVFQPEVGAATYTFYFMPYTYEGGDGAYRVAYSPRGGTKMDCPAPVSAIGSPTAWQTNNGTMKQSLASPQSPSAAAGRYYATNAVWKTVDGNFNFSTRTPADKCITPSGRDICEGFDGASGIEQLIYDFGDCVRLDGFALWAVGDGVHDPHGMSLAVANSSEAGAAWVTVHEFVGKANTSEKQVFDFSSSPNATRSSRFWRWTIADRCCVLPRYQAYVREVEFQASALGAIKAVGGFSNRAWLTQHRLSESPSGVAAATALPHVAVSNYTARTEWDRFHASEIRATAAETAAAVAPALAASEAAELFMSKRTEPIRMHDALPLFWTQTPRPARHLLTDTVHVHEYYVFQIGVYALQDLEITGFQVHGATNVTCFNLGGTNFHGSSFNQTQRVNASTIGALSFGLPVPATAASQLEITISLEFASQAKSQPLKLKLAVEQKPLIANGTADSWRMARMRWLDSNRGMSLQPSAQFSALVVNSETKSIAFSENRTVTLGANGLPAAITSRGRPILAGPVEFKLGAATFAPEGDVELTQLGAGLALWRASMLSSSTPNAGWRITVQGSCSYDGYIEFNVTVHCVADNDCESESGAELMVPIRSDAVRWFMGLSAASGSWPPRLQSSPTIRGGRQGTAWRTRSVGFAWQDYSRNKPRMQAWLGTPEAGIRIKLKGTEDAWNSPIELPDDAATMTNLAWASCAANGSTACTSWDTYNEVCCSGLINVTQDTPDNDIVFKATTGQPLRVAAGTSKPFVLDLLVTPNKPVSTHQHFTTRYYHFGGEFPWPGAMMEDAVDLVLAQNATWLNIHQGSNLNLYIDYPLRSDLPGGDRLAEMVEACHARGAHVKLYFTTRELTNRCSELFLVKALPNHEIIFGGAGGGGAWLQEHVNSDYTTAWSQPSPDRHNPGGPSLHGVSILGDEAVADSGYGRWNNFYVSAVNHLVVTEPKVDGLYLDGIAFDRTTLERVRKGMEAANKPVRIDIHMSNAGGCQSPGWRSPALGYMQHFSFADSLWFGEGFGEYTTRTTHPVFTGSLSASFRTPTYFLWLSCAAVAQLLQLGLDLTSVTAMGAIRLLGAGCGLVAARNRRHPIRPDRRHDPGGASGPRWTRKLGCLSGPKQVARSRVRHGLEVDQFSSGKPNVDRDCVSSTVLVT